MGWRQTACPRVGWAAPFFPETGAIAAGVVAAFAVQRTNGGGIAAVRAALGEPGGTDAFAAAGNLLAGAFDRGRSWRFAHRRIGVTFHHRLPDDGCTSKPKQSFQNRAPGSARRQRTGQMIETRTVHRDSFL